MKKTICLFVILLVFNCKNDSKDLNKKDIFREDVMKEVTIKDGKKLLVHINAVVPVDDVFEVYFYEVGSESFNSRDYVPKKVEGMEIAQDIIFEMPKNILPERLRLDFGKTPKQKEILLNSVKLMFGNKEYVFTKNELVNEFKPSKYIQFNKETMAIKTKEIDGRYDPYFYTKKVSNIVNYLMED